MDVGLRRLMGGWSRLTRLYLVLRNRVRVRGRRVRVRSLLNRDSRGGIRIRIRIRVCVRIRRRVRSRVVGRSARQSRLIHDRAFLRLERIRRRRRIVLLLLLVRQPLRKALRHTTLVSLSSRSRPRSDVGPVAKVVGIVPRVARPVVLQIFHGEGFAQRALAA